MTYNGAVQLYGHVNTPYAPQNSHEARCGSIIDSITAGTPHLHVNIHTHHTHYNKGIYAQCTHNARVPGTHCHSVTKRLLSL